VSDDPLGELLISENLMTSQQLKTALDFQKSLGGDLRSIVVKLGYVKDNQVSRLVASQEHVEHVGSAAEITADVIDFAAVKVLQARELLEKYLIVPLKSDGHSLVLAMADPNDLAAIEEVQFIVNQTVEPAVATKAAIRKTLNQMHELIKQHDQAGGPKTSLSSDQTKALHDMPLEKLMRAFVMTQIEAGQIKAEDLLARASKL
jgi:type IV pilus assembly protein PilB